MRRLEDHLVARQRELRLEQTLGLALEERELLEELWGVRFVECVFRLLEFVLEENVTIRSPLDVLQVEYGLDVLQIHRQSFEPVGDLACNRVAVQASDLLE